MLKSLADVNNMLDETVGVAPLVVIPGYDLEQVVADDVGEGQVDDARVRVADEVAGDEWLVGDVEDALEARFLGGGGEGGVDLLDGDVALGDEGKVGQRDDRGGHADG